MARFNSCTNPKLANNDTGWVQGTRVTGINYFGTTTTGYRTAAINSLAIGPFAIAGEGENYLFNFRIRNLYNATVGMIVQAAFYSPAGSLLSTSSEGVINLPANFNGRVTRIVACPSGTGQIRVYYYSTTHTEAIVGSEFLYERNVSTYAGYFDGDTPGAVWDGTPENSSSTIPDLNPNPTETYNVDDTVQSLTIISSATDSADFTDQAQVEELTVFKTASDNFVVTDAGEVARTVFPSASDSATVSETADLFVTHDLDDTTNATDARTDTQITHAREEIVNLEDNVTSTSVTTSTSDTFDLADTGEVFFDVPKLASDKMTVTESATVFVTHERSDTATTTDATTASTAELADDDSTSAIDNPGIPGPVVSDSADFDQQWTTLDGWLDYEQTVPVIEDFEIYAELPVVSDYATVTEVAFVLNYIPEFDDIIIYRDEAADAKQRVMAQHIFTGEWLHWDLPLHDIELTYNLSAPNVFRATFKTDVENIKQIGLVPNATWLHVEEAGQIRASFIYVKPKTSNERQTQTVEGIGFSVYPEWVDYEGQSIKLIQEDPANIIRYLWSYVQSFEDGNLGVIWNPSVRSKTLVGTEQKDVEFETGAGEQVAFEAGPYDLNYWEVVKCGAEIKKLLAEAHMEYVERSYWNSNKSGVVQFYDLKYPRAGTKRTDIVFRQGENLAHIIPSFTESDDSQITDVIVVGAGEGSSAIRAWVARRTGRLRRTKTIEDESISSFRRALEIARFELNRINRLGAEIDQIVVRTQHPNAPWGTFGTGDDIWIEGEIRFVGKVSGWYRITSYKYTRRSKYATLEVAPSESFAYGEAYDPE